MDTKNSEIFTQLKAPIPADQIRWRVGATNEDKTQGRALPYIDARVVQNRLDEVMGPGNWKNSYSEVIVGSRLLAVRCILSLHLDGQWVSKEDAAYLPATHRDDPSFEIAVKGVYSDSLKRAAVQWGIARYLYDFEAPMVDLINGKLSSTPDVDEVLRAQKAAHAAGAPAEAVDAADAPEASVAASQTTASAPAPQAQKTEVKEAADKPKTTAPAPAPTAKAPAPAAAPAATKDTAPAREESAPVDETKYGVNAPAQAPAAAPAAKAPAPAPAPAAKAPAPAAASPAPAPAASASDAADGADGQQSVLFKEIRYKLKNGVVPAAMLLSYVQGPKGQEKLTPDERQQLVNELTAAIGGAPAAAAA